jgi:hypothetical protein
MCHPGSYIPISKCSFPSGECGNLGLAELLCLGWMFTALLSLCYGPFSSWSPHQIPKSLTAVSQDLTATTPEIKKTVWDWQLPYQREDFLIQGYKSPVTNGMNGCQFFQSESSSLSLPRMKQRVAAESNCAVRGTEWQMRLLLCDILVQMHDSWDTRGKICKNMSPGPKCYSLIDRKVHLDHPSLI